MTEPASKAKRRWALAGLCVAGIAVAYAVAGGLLAPLVAKNLGERRLSEALGRPVAIERVRINPFTWRAEVDGLRISEPDGRPFASLDSLALDLGVASLRHLAPVADEVTLRGLRVRLVRLDESTYNVSDILARLAARPAAPRDERPLRYSLHDIRLQDGAIDFEDGPVGARHSMTRIDLAIPFLSNLPVHRKSLVRPSFAASVDGAPLSLTGEALPFEDTHATRVAIELEKIDLTRYAGYAPVPIPLGSGNFDARIEIRFAQPPGAPPTMLLKGTAAVRDLAMRLAAAGGDLRAGRIDVDVEALDPIAGTLRIAALMVSDAEALGGRLKVPLAEARGAKADLAHRRLEVATVRSADGTVLVRRRADGAIDLPFEPSREARPEDAWRVAVAQLDLENYQVTVLDEAVKPEARHAATLVRVGLTDFTSERGGSGRLEGRARLASGGELLVATAFGVEPLALEGRIDARGVNVVQFRRYAGALDAIELSSGTVSASGRFTADAKRVAYKGNAAIERLSTVDLVRKEPLLDWRSVRASDVAVQWSPDAPFALHVGEVAIDRAYSRVIIHADGKLNLQHLRAAGGEAPPGAAPPKRDVRIARITFSDSRLDFTDNFIKPNYRANVGALHGSVSGLSSEAQSRAEVRLEGRFDESSPVVIEGAVNPLRGDLFVDIAARGRDIELPRLSAYSQRYAGYGITQGKLALDVAYRIEEGKLEGRNRVVLDQLTFGEKVESPDAIKLPLIFAVNLLKDAEGRIDLELPVSGSLEDPQFELGALVGEVVMRLIKKAVTNPFSVIAAAFGGGTGTGNGNGDAGAAKAAETGEDLAFVEFEAGRDELAPRALAKLEVLGRALAGRPGLRLELAPRFDREREARALRLAALAAKVSEAKERELGAAGAAPVGEDEYPRFLRAAYASEVGGEKAAAESAELSLAALESRLLERIEVGDAEMNALAARRAQSIKRHLIGARGIADERVTLAAAPEAPGEAPGASRILFALR